MTWKISNAPDYVSSLLFQAGVMREDGSRLDANESIFVARQLEHVVAETYRTQLSPLKSAQFIPFKWDLPAGATSWVYRQWSDIAPPRAKVVANYAEDFPDVGLHVEEAIKPIRSIGDAYGYSVQDLRAAAFAKVPLETELARVARETIERTIDDYCAFGDATNNVAGFINNAALTSVAPAVGTWDAATTAAEMHQDLTKLVDSVIQASKNVYRPDTLLLPLSVHGLLMKPYSTLNGESILSVWFKNQNIIKNIDFWHLLDTNAGVTAEGTSKALAVAYVRDETVIKFRGAIPFEQMPPQTKNMYLSVPCHARIGGVNIFQPLAMRKMDLLA